MLRRTNGRRHQAHPRHNLTSRFAAEALVPTSLRQSGLREHCEPQRHVKEIEDNAFGCKRRCAETRMPKDVVVRWRARTRFPSRVDWVGRCFPLIWPHCISRLTSLHQTWSVMVQQHSSSRSLERVHFELPPVAISGCNAAPRMQTKRNPAEGRISKIHSEVCPCCHPESFFLTHVNYALNLKRASSYL